jgi:gas vesicle protein
MGPQGPAGQDAIPYDDTEIIGRLDGLGTNQSEILDKLGDALDQGATNQEAIQQVADDLGVAVDDLMGALGTTEGNLTNFMSDMEGRLNLRLDDLKNKVQEGIDVGKSERDALDDAIGEVADELGVAKTDILDQLGTTRDDLRDEIGATEQRLGTQMTDIGRQIGLRDLLGTLSEPGVLSQQVDVGEAELADIGDLYTFESIFRTPEQEARFATPYDSAEIERMLRELGVA